MTKTRLFSGFTHEECSQFRKISKAVRRNCTEGEILVAEGSVIDFFAIVLQGDLLCEKNDYSGRVELIQNYAEGELICFDIVCTTTRRCPFRLRCLKDSKLLIFRCDALTHRQEYLSARIYDKLHANIMHFLANENIKKLYKIDVLYKRTLREKILVFLRNMETITGESTLHIRMDREQFAQYLGVNRSSLSHELSLMQAEGLFHFKKDCFVLEKQPAKTPKEPVAT
jgi:CRP-like cAMP-binding protein